MRSCANDLPATVVTELFGYLKHFWQPVDFMPGPEPFLPGAASEEEIEQTKRVLRPKYVQLYQLMRDRDSVPGR